VLLNKEADRTLLHFPLEVDILQSLIIVFNEKINYLISSSKYSCAIIIQSHYSDIVCKI